MYTYNKEHVHSKLVEVLNNNPNVITKLRKNERVKKQTIDNWLSGKTEPSLKKLIAIANYANVSIEYFFDKKLVEIE